MTRYNRFCWNLIKTGLSLIMLGLLIPIFLSCCALALGT